MNTQFFISTNQEFNSKSLEKILIKNKMGLNFF